MALALQKHLTALFPWVDFWLSADIESGSDWRSGVAQALRVSDFGIICLVPSNVRKPWILFEAGALSKLERSRVVPYCKGIAASWAGDPLSQFQGVPANENGTRKLVEDIYRALPQQQRPMEEVIKKCRETWPALNEELESISVEQVWSVQYDCITADELLRRESVGGEICDRAHIYVNASSPLETSGHRFSAHVMKNIKSHVNYLYVFNIEPKIAGRVAVMIFNMCAGEQGSGRSAGEAKENLEQLKARLRIYIAEENYGFEYCILNADEPRRAHCYVRRPEVIDPQHAQWIAWCNGSEVRNMINQVDKLLENKTQEEQLLIKSTKSCDFGSHRERHVRGVC